MDNTITEATLSAVAEALGIPADHMYVQPVTGGYSRNKRALLKSNNGYVFAKEVDKTVLPGDGNEELGWLKKDYLTMEALRKVVPDIIPEWSHLELNDHVLLMKGYVSEDGWTWSPPEEPELRVKYIQSVIDAAKRLEKVSFEEKAIESLQLEPIFRDALAYDDGFSSIISHEAMRSQVIDKFISKIQNATESMQKKYRAIVHLLNDEQQLQVLADRGAQLGDQPSDSFGHCDVRSDNVAFNGVTGEVKFVDWNWASFIPSGFGPTEFMIDMGRRGVDVTPWLDEVNVELLAATVGFYLKRCIKEELQPGGNLRDMQTDAAAVAYELYKAASS